MGNQSENVGLDMGSVQYAFLGEGLRKQGDKFSMETMKILFGHGVGGIAGMADLEMINIDEVVDISEIDEGKTFTINGFEYRIINNKDKESLSRGNYYDFGAKKFVVVYNNGSSFLEYSPYDGSKKSYKKETGVVLGKEPLYINGFVGRLGKELTNDETKNGDFISEYCREYENMIGTYDIKFGKFIGEIVKKYGNTDSCVGFNGCGSFLLDNGVTLVGDFDIEYFLKKIIIFGRGKIIYPDNTVQFGYWDKKSGLYEMVYDNNENKK